jgi:hypothetical protein
MVSAKKTVTWEDEEDDEEEDYNEADPENNEMDCRFLMNSTEESLMPSDWEECIADRVSATIGEGIDSVFELFCEEVQTNPV